MAAKSLESGSKPALTTTQVMERAKSFWTGLRPQQQGFLGLGMAISLAILIFFAKLIATPDYKPLMKGLEQGDASAISAQLEAKKIPYIVSPDGSSISVPGDQVDAARLEVASHDSPHSGRIGFEIFDKISWGQTEFDEKVNYQRALEGELERTIQTMSEVKSARVHIVMATDSVFVDRERGAKASVTLRLRRGSLSKEAASAISRLLAGAVDELNPKDVVIVDADSNRSLGPGTTANDGGDGNEQELTRRLVATLTPVVGADHLRATVNVEYETGSSEESQEKYDPTATATLTMQHSEETMGPGAASVGVPGTSSNVPASKAAPVTVAKDISQVSKSDNNTYAVNKTTRHVIEPAGGIRRITAALLLDDAVDRKKNNGKETERRIKRSPEEMKLITDLAEAAIGFSSTRGDVISVQNLSFESPDPVDVPPPSALDEARKGLNDNSTVVRYAVVLCLFVLVYMLVIRPIQKRVLATPDPLLAASRTHARNEAELGAPIEVPGTLTQRSLLLKKQLAEFVNAEPESSSTAIRAWLREEAQ